MWRLRLVSGEAIPDVADVTDGCVLGRGADADVRIRSELASRKHATLHIDDDVLTVTDLNSANGTRVNGGAIERSQLSEGDVLRIGDVEFMVESAEVTQTAPPRPALPADDRSEPVTTRATVSVRIEHSMRDSTGDSSFDLIRWLADDGFGGTKIERLAAGAADGLDADDVAILVRVSAGGPYRIVCSHPPAESADPMPVSRALLARAAATREALLVSAEFPELSGRDSMMVREVGSAICAPLEADGTVLGAIYLQRGPERPPFTEVDLARTASLASDAGQALVADLAAFQRRENEQALDLDGDFRTARLVGGTPAFLTVIDIVERVASVPSSVLLQGEPATGRKSLACTIHAHSVRADRPLLVIPCADLSAGREAELILGEQSEEGLHPGLLARAGDGTLCLAEVGRLSLEAQDAIAGALESRKIVPVGAAASHPVRCRVLATTAIPLQTLVSAGKFLPKLQEQLSRVVVQVPSLRARADDVPLLAEHFAELHGRRIRGSRVNLTPEAIDALREHDYPGNVSELSTVIERVVLRTDRVEIRDDDVRAVLAAGTSATTPAGYSLEDAERVAVERALRASGGKKGAAAELLGVSWPTLTKKIRKYEL